MTIWREGQERNSLKKGLIKSLQLQKTECLNVRESQVGSPPPCLPLIPDQDHTARRPETPLPSHLVHLCCQSRLLLVFISYGRYVHTSPHSPDLLYPIHHQLVCHFPYTGLRQSHSAHLHTMAPVPLYLAFNFHATSRDDANPATYSK